jgi:hypothetical protein
MLAERTPNQKAINLNGQCARNVGRPPYALATAKKRNLSPVRDPSGSPFPARSRCVSVSPHSGVTKPPPIMRQRWNLIGESVVV